jgi:hypothetical protein
MKSWHEKPLWERVWLSGRKETERIYINCAKIIGHAGCTAQQFVNAASKLPGYDKFKYENAVRDLTVYVQREQGRFELHPSAKKVLKIILGPAPDDPEYCAWWKARLVSVRLMKEAGEPVEWAESPPVPLPEERPTKEEPAKPKRTAKKAEPKEKPAEDESLPEAPKAKRTRRKAAG